MIILGLTGSIGMGKSTTAQMFKDAGIPVYDADAAVHDLYGPNGKAVGPIARKFPGVISDDNAVDRDKLKAIVLKKSKSLMVLEDIVHPLVQESRKEFISKHEDFGTEIVLLDIPLLFEVGLNESVDKIVVVTAPYNVQKERVLSREGMTEENFQTILAKQMPDKEKRASANYVIDTSRGMDDAREQVQFVLDDLKSK